MTTVLDSQKPARAAWWRLVLVALLLRVVYIAMVPMPERYRELPREGDPPYFGMIAQHLVDGQGFLEVRARAYRPPVFPALMALSFAVFSDRTLPIQLLLAICGALHCLLTVRWCLPLVGQTAAWRAGWLTACYPQFVRYPQSLYGEPLFLALLALVVWRLVSAAQEGSARQAAVAGILCGLAALTREVALVVPPAYALWAACDQTLPRRARTWLVFCCACGMTIVPWTIRNYLVLEAFVPISTNVGVNMYNGNNPLATPYLQTWRVAPGVSWDDGANELAAHREGMAAALRYMAEDPLRTIRMSATKLWWFLRPPTHGFEQTQGPQTVLRVVWLVYYLALLALAARGLWIERRRWQAVALPAWIMIGICATIVLTKCEIRYRLPVIAMLVCYAGAGCQARARRDI